MSRARTRNRFGTRGTDDQRASSGRSWTWTVWGLLSILVTAGLGAAVALIVPSRASRGLPRRVQRAVENSRVLEGHRGPWGVIEYTRIAISMPLEYTSDYLDASRTRWWFDGASRQRVESILAGAALTPDQARQIAQSSWEVLPDGVWVEPPRELVATLSPSARSHIYGVLSQHERNPSQHDPVVVDPRYVDEHLESSGLSEQTIALVRSLRYPRKSWTLFSDTGLVLGTLTTNLERRRFSQMIYRRTTLMARLIIDQTSDLEAMIAYWSFPGRRKGLRSLFESLARVPGGGELDIAHVLTPFARQHLYAFPDASNESAPRQRRDSRWTALNFFSDQPDEDRAEPEYSTKMLEREYHRVSAPTFGDVVALIGKNGEAVHLANHVADGLTFTKNGHQQTQPWILVNVDDLVALHSLKREAKLDVWYFRRRR